jgi:ABC-type multidrug transport system fused ATPase/permease subunit
MLYVSATITAASRGSEGMDDFYSAMVMSLMLFAVEKLLQFAGRITMFHGEQLFTFRLKREVYAACLRQDMEFFDSQKCGELQKRLNSDTAEVCQKSAVLSCPFYPVFVLHDLQHFSAVDDESTPCVCNAVGFAVIHVRKSCVGQARAEVLQEDPKAR